MRQNKVTLVVLAAGIGSRFGGVKQLSPVGPSGETIIDYSLYDAIAAGFDRVVFIIRRDIEADFYQVIGRAWEKSIEVAYVFQELSSGLPEGWTPPPDRIKPWGTAHAVMMVKGAVDGPFAVINADDFYGRKSFEVMHNFLLQVGDNPKKAGEKIIPEYALACYRLKYTLSDFGPVCRGLCRLEGEYITEIKEMRHIEKTERGAKARLDEGGWLELSGEEVVSMNFWGFDFSIFSSLETGFRQFLKERGQDPKAEFLIPDHVGELVCSGQARVRYLPSEERWFGITYPEDLEGIRAGIASLVAAGIYPLNIKKNITRGKK